MKTKNETLERLSKEVVYAWLNWVHGISESLDSDAYKALADAINNLEEFIGVNHLDVAR